MGGRVGRGDQPGEVRAKCMAMKTCALKIYGDALPLVLLNAAHLLEPGEKGPFRRARALPA